MTKVCGSTMGYTHYWRTNLNLQKKTPVIYEESWQSYKRDVDTLFVITKRESEQYIRDLEISDNRIYFNGCWETFHLEKYPQHELFNFDTKYKDWSFNFCKTNQKPYDKWVTACLILAIINMGIFMKISSDGDLWHWKEGLKLAKEVMKQNYSGHKIMRFGMRIDYDSVELCHNKDDIPFSIGIKWLYISKNPDTLNRDTLLYQL